MFNIENDLQKIKNLPSDNIGDWIGIEWIELGEDYIIAKMPVDHRTKQPFGLLHGGASVVLAETLGSVASVLLLKDLSKQAAVGVEINANHLRGVKSGWVYGKVKPVHIGRKSHVWEIKISDENEKLVCISRLTVMIVDLKND
jgi:1,4-dihydroxy-2-naphthoyl-CoA hydrolase